MDTEKADLSFSSTSAPARRLKHSATIKPKGTSTKQKKVRICHYFAIESDYFLCLDAELYAKKEGAESYSNLGLSAMDDLIFIQDQNNSDSDGNEQTKRVAARKPTTRKRAIVRERSIIWLVHNIS